MGEPLSDKTPEKRGAKPPPGPSGQPDPPPNQVKHWLLLIIAGFGAVFLSLFAVFQFGRNNANCPPDEGASGWTPDCVPRSHGGGSSTAGGFGKSARGFGASS